MFNTNLMFYQNDNVYFQAVSILFKNGKILLVVDY